MVEILTTPPGVQEVGERREGRSARDIYWG
jgi:hypothetical protein